MEFKNSRDGNERKFMRRLFIACYSDVARASGLTNRTRRRDLLEISSRLDREGISFITKTLPKVAKAIDKALATGTPLYIPGFRKDSDGCIPCFLGSILYKVFDSSGYERSDASTEALGQLRQLLYLFYKYELPYDAKDEKRVIDSFKEVEKELAADKATWADPARLDQYSNILPRLDYGCDLVNSNLERIEAAARRLICSVLAPHDPIADIRPRHGPGAVATGEKNWEKAVFKRYYSELAKVFPYEEHFYYNSTHLCDQLQDYLGLHELHSGTARVVLVPKDSRGPRLISCEPLEYQWIQQALMSKMTRIIESDRRTKGKVNFTSQQVNRDLAMKGSIDGSMATIDMQEASDRVSMRHVAALFPQPWVRALFAARSSSTMLPDGEVVALKKFAPMGSATCFPVEALLFWALSVSALAVHYERERSHPSDWEDTSDLHFSANYFGVMPKWGRVGTDYLDLASSQVYVYGDDIIIPSHLTGVVVAALEAFQLRVNFDKCCSVGFFRESCGCDAYKGVDVTPVRIRTRWSPSFLGTSLFSYCCYHNSLCDKGYYSVADLLAREIRQAVPDVPYVEETIFSAYACLTDSRKWGPNLLELNQRLKRRYNDDLQRWEAKGWAPHCPVITAQNPGWNEMLRVTSLAPDEGASTRDILASMWVFDPADPLGYFPIGRSGSLTEALRWAEVFNFYSYRPDLLRSYEKIGNRKVRAYQYARVRRVTRVRTWLPLTR
jgi:hypothetical protein